MVSNPYTYAIKRHLDMYYRDHGNTYPEIILIHPDIWEDVIREVGLMGNTWDGYLWNVLAVKDNTIDTAWKFVGAPVLEHKKCILCGIVVHGHNLDGKWACEHCYDRITRNMGIMNEQWQKIVRESNERVAQAMDKNYFEAYKEILFGDTADWFNFNSKE